MYNPLTLHQRQRVNAYLRLSRIDRPIGALLLLWPTLWALWLAGDGQPEPTIVVIFILGTFIMRAAGCVLNDFADRDFDRHVARTKNRPLTCGEISPRGALTYCLGLLLLALSLVLLLNRFTQLLAVVAVLIAATYPLFKRFTHLPQCMLGVAFSCGIPMAYTALTDSLVGETWLLFFANFMWIIAYDTQYAMVDRADDLKIGIRSTAILFGRYDNLMIGIMHLVCLLTLGVLGLYRDFSWHYYLALSGALGCALYQQTLCRQRQPSDCFKAFLNNNWFGGIVFAGLILVT